MTSSKHKKRARYFIILVFMFCVALSVFVYNLLNTPLISLQNPPMILTLDKATSANQFVNKLKENHLIYSTKLLQLIIRFQGFSHQLKAGAYEIHPGESAMQLIKRVVAGDVIQLNFSIIEGTTQQKISQDLQKAPYLEYDPLVWETIKGNYPNAEGLLLADTYQYGGGSNSKSLLQHAHRNLLLYLNNSWATRSTGLPYKSPYELLIAASIIEKESAISQEKKLISGVILNRLKVNMPLQMDPTVIYGLGDQYRGKLAHSDMQVDSPYNTYRYRGLPPTPIAMVGKESIDAAAHPQISKYLYFVARGDGSHQFSESYQQQKQAIEHYRNKGY